ncbi:MAG TPA: hypothetical protein DCS93_10315 [Microscillaceae bacterium]|nr:hypothetical protein [Microscillaceae bacterium]
MGFLLLCMVIIDTNAQSQYRNSRGMKKSLQQLPTPSTNSDYSRAVYDAKGRLIMENFWGCAGQTCIKRIEYHYNAQNQLTQQVLFYTGTPNPRDQAKQRHTTHFFYDKQGRLNKVIVEKQGLHKRALVKTIRYQANEKKYGENGQKPNKLYSSLQDVVRQQLNSKRHPMFIRK